MIAVQLQLHIQYPTLHWNMTFLILRDISQKQTEQFDRTKKNDCSGKKIGFILKQERLSYTGNIGKRFFSPQVNSWPTFRPVI